MKSLAFGEIVARLRQWQREAAEQPVNPAARGEALKLKTQLSDAIGCLILCERHQIPPMAKVTQFPDTEAPGQNPVFRVIDDHGTNRREQWIEVVVKGEPLRPAPGSLLIERSRS